MNLTLEIYNKLREDTSEKWLCDRCQQSDVTVENAAEFPAKEICITKVDLVNIKREIVDEISAIFHDEINNLRSLLLTQSKHISDLTEEICLLKMNKNPITTIPDDDNIQISTIRNSVVESPHMEQICPDVPIINLSGNSGNDELNIKQLDKDDNSPKWIVATSKNRNKIKQKSHSAEKVEKPPLKQAEGSKKKRKPIVGTSKTHNLHAVPKIKFSHIHITRLSPETTTSDLENFFNGNIPNVSCEQLTSRKPEVYSSFKLTLPTEFLEKVLSPDFWPEGIAVNEFFTKRRLSYNTS